MEPRSQDQQGASGPVRGLLRGALWPLRRILDPRFAGLAAQVASEAHDTREHVGALVGDSRTELLRANAELKAVLEGRLEELRTLAVADLDSAAEASTIVGEELTTLAAEVEALREGRQAAGSAELVEVPYAFGAVARLPAGARLLVLGASGSTLALSLASLGFTVTALDSRLPPHPHLSAVEGTVEDCAAAGPFGGVICLSAFGPDEAALKRLHELTAPEGLLVLTTRLGHDREELERLLADWRVDDLTVVGRRDATTWAPTEEPDAEAVALVTARR